jgi:general secretion pathway protein E
LTLSAGVGCGECAGTGYKGRTGAFEVMVMNDTVRELVLQRKPATAVMDAAVAGGMTTLRGAFIRKVVDGATSVDELQRLMVVEVG